jgi:hypothetical protein
MIALFSMKFIAPAVWLLIQGKMRFPECGAKLGVAI